MGRKAIILAQADIPVQRRPDEGPAWVRVANRPIVSHVLESLEAAGVTETAVVGPAAAVADLQATIAQEGPGESALTFLPVPDESGLMETLAPAVPFIGDAECIVHSADGLLGDPLGPLADRLRPGHPDLLLLLHGGARRHDARDQEALQLLRISEITGFSSPTALAGACLLGSGVLGLTCTPDEGTATETKITRLAERVAAAGGQVQAGRVSWRSYSGDPRDLLEMNRMVLDQLPAPTPIANGGENQIEGRVLIHPSAEVRSSLIAGPVIIGAGARVENAYIGPYTSVGSDAVVEGSEISRSIILEGAQILHVRDRIEASTIGRGAFIRTEFALPRGMRLHVGEGIEMLFS
ncbi:MAG TPA: NDP-sugar synthase [Solirubrobacteraceae bacterium]|jgi:glucose-1-phosphate thymidylyltransferase|nr:NDP-sugar synthase [Solirubrobacteraceae bacterium]